MNDHNQMTKSSENLEVATLGGGCFWCLEAVYEELKGVDGIVSGYSGGSVPNPSYRQVGTGTSGHAEVVQLTYNANEVAYRDLLRVFFTTHDPTTRDRQGADIGPQYRSIILYHSPEQQAAAREVMAEIEAQKVWKNALVTEVVPYDVFYPAEDYHQNYYQNNSRQPYCQVVIAPKVSKFRKMYAERLKAGL